MNGSDDVVAEHSPALAPAMDMTEPSAYARPSHTATEPSTLLAYSDRASHTASSRLPTLRRPGLLIFVGLALLRRFVGEQQLLVDLDVRLVLRDGDHDRMMLIVDVDPHTLLRDDHVVILILCRVCDQPKRHR